jgi:hypothetical protein
MFLLFHLLSLFSLCSFFCLSSLSSGQTDEGQDQSPHLLISSVSGNLEQDRLASIFVVVENNASVSKRDANLVSKEPDEFGLNKENARRIVAELICSDDRIKVLSEPQLAGLLAGGENATLQFTALAEGVPLGIYPFELCLNYSWLSAVAVSDDEGATDFVFDYKAESASLPLQVKVMMGPRIELAEPEGRVASGRESVLRLTLTNRGDEPARDLQMQARPASPFLMVENGNGNENVSISPGESVDLSRSIFTDENATAGYYALPCRITYRGGEDGEQRSEEIAALVYVGATGYSSWLDLSCVPALMNATGLARFVLLVLLLLLLVAAGLWLKRALLRKRRWVR